MESGTATRKAIDAGTFAEAFRIQAANRPDEVFVRTKGEEGASRGGEMRERVAALAGGRAKLGLERGQCIALLLPNRPEFHLADLAAITVGATPFSIYMTYSPEQIQYVCSDAEAKIMITEPEFLPQVLEARKDLPDLEHVILVEGEHEGCLRLDEVEGSNADFDAEAAVKAVEPDDVLTLIYTSGTTGPPKGVQIAHRNMMAGVRSTEETIQFPEGSRVISWLPAAHIAERAAHHYLPIAYGFQVTCCPNPREVMQYLPEVRPQWFFAVPRIWEKLKSGLETMVAGLPDEQRTNAQASLDAAIEKVRLEQRGEPVPDDLAEKVRAADEQLFSGLRTHLGFDQVVAVNVGAARTPLEVLEFFHAIGVPVSELWGMSETCGAGSVNPPDAIKLGTVGKPGPGIEIKLADDGEVLVRSEVVMIGYRNMPEKTAEAIDDDGWMHTGDIGEFDDDGYLKIVDRKKEIIINAAGKNMSPAYIEAQIKTASPLIGQAVAIGDRRSYNVALITLDPDYAPAWAAQNGLEGESLEDLAREEKVREEVSKGIEVANSKLARVEQPKKLHIIEGDWEPGGEELTPTMKLKRKPIDQKYSDVIEDLYSGPRE